MNLLNALLAFSITMLIFSTMSLVIVEVYHRINRTREKYFELMVATFFDCLIWPKVEKLFVNERKDYAVSKSEFVRSMLSVSGLPDLDIETKTAVDGKGESFRKSIRADKTTERLDASEFCQRLARTSAGLKLLELGEDNARIMILDIARNLESVSTGATANFRVKSRLLSIIVAIPLVLFFNIDAIHLFRSYAAQPSYVAAMTTFDRTGVSGHIVGESANDRVSTSHEKAGYRGDANAGGVAIGWENFPACNLSKLSSDSRCSATSGLQQSAVLSGVTTWGGWVIGLLCSVFLIGQGAPFWFDMFQKITWIMQVAKGLGMGKKIGKGLDQATTEVESMQLESGAKAIDPVDAFMIAVRAKQLELSRK